MSVRQPTLRRGGAGGSGVLPVWVLAGAMLLAGAPPCANAQQAGARGDSAGRAGRPVPSARARAPFDPTGYWVSLVTENWRYRMVVPGHGDYAGIPISAKARQFADAWQPAADVSAGKQCEAYGAPAVMQIPERLHITWQDDETLRVDTDEGMQTRLLHFGPAASGDAISPSLQGFSRARWALFTLANAVRAGAQPNDSQRHGSLVVSTEQLLPGLLRKNGVPYGADTRLSEFWKVNSLGSHQWLLISTKVTDPEYLTVPYVYDSIFQKEADGSKWDPSACSLTS